MFEITEYTSGFEDLPNLAVDFPFTVVGAMMNGKAGSNNVEAAVAWQPVFKVVLNQLLWKDSGQFRVLEAEATVKADVVLRF